VELREAALGEGGHGLAVVGEAAGDHGADEASEGGSVEAEGVGFEFVEGVKVDEVGGLAAGGSVGDFGEDSEALGVEILGSGESYGLWVEVGFSFAFEGVEGRELGFGAGLVVLCEPGVGLG